MKSTKTAPTKKSHRNTKIINFSSIVKTNLGPIKYNHMSFLYRKIGKKKRWTKFAIYTSNLNFGNYSLYLELVILFYVKIGWQLCFSGFNGLGKHPEEKQGLYAFTQAKVTSFVPKNLAHFLLHCVSYNCGGVFENPALFLLIVADFWNRPIFEIGQFLK